MESNDKLTLGRESEQVRQKEEQKQEQRQLSFRQGGEMIER
jgi:hypothetical protein